MRWWILFLLFLATLINYMDRTIFAVLIPVIRVDLHIDMVPREDRPVFLGEFVVRTPRQPCGNSDVPRWRRIDGEVRHPEQHSDDEDHGTYVVATSLMERVEKCVKRGMGSRRPLRRERLGWWLSPLCERGARPGLSSRPVRKSEPLGLEDLLRCDASMRRPIDRFAEDAGGPM